MVRKAERMVQWELCSPEHREQGQGGTGEGEGSVQGSKVQPDWLGTQSPGGAGRGLAGGDSVAGAQL